MKCLDDDSLTQLFGNYDSNVANNLMIVFEKCDSTVRACKTDQEITDWLVFKYIILFENSRRFIPHQFANERIQSLAQIRWFPIAKDQRSDTVKMVTRSKINLNDY